MPPGSRTPLTLRTTRGRRRWKRRLASIRHRQRIAWLRTVVSTTDPERFRHRESYASYQRRRRQPAAQPERR